MENGRFYTRGRTIHLGELGQAFVVRLGILSRIKAGKLVRR